MKSWTAITVGAAILATAVIAMVPSTSAARALEGREFAGCTAVCGTQSCGVEGNHCNCACVNNEPKCTCAES
jgi:hypothetical protein